MPMIRVEEQPVDDFTVEGCLIEVAKLRKGGSQAGAHRRQVIHFVKLCRFELWQKMKQKQDRGIPTELTQQILIGGGQCAVYDGASWINYPERNRG